MEGAFAFGRSTTPDLGQGRTRSALGPRLKSYLSSSNLLTLGSTSTMEPKQSTDVQWPEFTPTYDASTVPGNRSLDKWISALRHRLWEYDDVPLGVEYNAPIRWLTDECIKVTRQHTEVSARVAALEQENQNLRSELMQQAQHSHRISHSGPDAQKASEASLELPKRQHSNSLPETSLPREDTGNRRSSGGKLKSPTTDGLTRSNPSPTSAGCSSLSKHSDGAVDFATDEENSLQFRQSAALMLSKYVADQLGNDPSDHYPGIAGILGLSISLPTKILPLTNSKGRGMKTDVNVTLAENTNKLVQNSSVRPRYSRAPNSTNRLFSFYPGDDNALESFERYSAQQQPVDNNQSILSSIKLPVVGENGSKDIGLGEEAQRAGLGREDSQASVVTVVNVSRDRRNDNGTSQDTAGATGGLVHGNSGSEDKTVEKPQGPLAAALAATSRFGKNGKKTVRLVP